MEKQHRGFGIPSVRGGAASLRFYTSFVHVLPCAQYQNGEDRHRTAKHHSQDFLEALPDGLLSSFESFSRRFSSVLSLLQLNSFEEED